MANSRPPEPIDYSQIVRNYARAQQTALARPGIDPDWSLQLEAPLQAYFNQLFIDLEPRLNLNPEEHLNGKTPVRTTRPASLAPQPGYVEQLEALFAIAQTCRGTTKASLITVLNQLSFIADQIAVLQELAAELSDTLS